MSRRQLPKKCDCWGWKEVLFARTGVTSLGQLHTSGLYFRFSCQIWRPSKNAAGRNMKNSRRNTHTHTLSSSTRKDLEKKYTSFCLCQEKYGISFCLPAEQAKACSGWRDFTWTPYTMMRNVGLKRATGISNICVGNCYCEAYPDLMGKPFIYVAIYVHFPATCKQTFFSAHMYSFLFVLV